MREIKARRVRDAQHRPLGVVIELDPSGEPKLLMLSDDEASELHDRLAFVYEWEC